MSTQTALLVTPADYEALRAEREDLRAQVADEIAAGERQAGWVLELHRLIASCPECTAAFEAAVKEEVNVTKGEAT